MKLLALVLLAALPCVVVAQDLDDAARKRAIAERLAASLEPVLLAKWIGAPAIYGAAVCTLEGQLAQFEAARAYELEIGRESGVVNLEGLHDSGEAIVLLRGELAELQTSMAKYGVTPLDCDSDLVAALLGCAGPQCAVLERQADAILAYAALPAKGAEVEAMARAVLAAKSPDVLAELEQRVEVLLATLGSQAPPDPRLRTRPVPGR